MLEDMGRSLFRAKAIGARLPKRSARLDPTPETPTMLDPAQATAALPPFRKLNWLRRDIELENRRAALQRRAVLVARLYAAVPDAVVVVID
jgi:tRNA 2-selenouridine synthase SelU